MTGDLQQHGALVRCHCSERQPFAHPEFGKTGHEFCAAIILPHSQRQQVWIPSEALEPIVAHAIGVSGWKWAMRISLPEREFFEINKSGPDDE
jgi:hypothetical protein